MSSPPLHVHHASIHLALFVVEDAQLQHLGDQFVGDPLGVLWFRADEHQETLLNSADVASGNFDVGTAYPLNERNHVRA